MNVKLRTSSFTFPVEWPKLIHSQILYGLAIVLLGCLIGFAEIRFASLASAVDPARLVPVSSASVLQAIIWAMFLGFIGVTLTRGRSDIPHPIILFAIAFVLRVVTGIILSFMFQYDDEYSYHAAGMEQIYGMFSLDVGKGYYHLVNILYAAIGPNFLLPKMVNALLGSLLPFFAYDLGQRIFDDPKAGWRAFLLTAFLPPLVIYSALSLKEIATAFFLVLTLWFLVVNPRYGIWKIAGATATIGALYWLRGAPWAVITLPGVATYIVLGKNWRFSRLMQLGSWIKIVFVIALSAFFLLPFLIEPINQMVLSRLTQETYFIERFTESQATVMQFVNVSDPLALENLGILFLRGLFSPSPLRFFLDYGLDTVIEAFNMVVWYLFFPFAMVGLLDERQKGTVIACGMTALSVLAMATMGIMVGSNPYHHRISMLGLLFVLAGGGLKKEAYRRHRWIFYFWWLGAFMFTAVWLRFRI